MEIELYKCKCGSTDISIHYFDMFESYNSTESVLTNDWSFRCNTCRFSQDGTNTLEEAAKRWNESIIRSFENKKIKDSIHLKFKEHDFLENI